MLKLSTTLAAAALLSGCAAAGEAPQARSSLASGQCFRTQDVNNFNVGDQRRIYVSTRQGYVFELQTDADCFKAATDSVTVSPFLTSGPLICAGQQAAVSVGQARAVPQRCISRVSGPITDSSVSGLRSRQP